jgi:hypothetical protein
MSKYQDEVAKLNRTTDHEIDAADVSELGRLRADNLRLVEIIARYETHYQAAMAMSEKHRKLWVEACQERERIRAALQSLIKTGPRPWMDGGVTWPEWDAAMQAAEDAIKATDE